MDTPHPEIALSQRLARLKLMAFDVDGVLTDGRIYYTDNGAEMKAFHTLDGLGIKLLSAAGLKIGLITARRSEVVERRARDLGVHFCFQGAAAKHVVFGEMLDELKLAPEQAGYVGDDLVDLPVLVRAGFAATVPAAPADVKTRCHYVTSAHGGHGAAREVCEMILRAQGVYDKLLAEYCK